MLQTDVKLIANSEPKIVSSNFCSETKGTSDKNSIFTGGLIGTFAGIQCLNFFANTKPESAVAKRTCGLLERAFLRLKNPVAKHLFTCGLAGAIIFTGTLAGAGLGYLLNRINDNSANQDNPHTDNNTESQFVQMS